jgi:hypothetical protein
MLLKPGFQVGKKKPVLQPEGGIPMGGPSASLLLPVPLTERQIDELDTWLHTHTVDLHGTPLNWSPFWVHDGASLGMAIDPSIEPCAFGLHAGTPLTYLEEWERAQVIQLIDYDPQQELGFFAGCHRPLDHRILGHLALFLAERYGGLIDLSGAITPPLQPNWHYNMRGYYRPTLEEIHQFVQGLPGKVIEVPYGEETGKPWVFHIVDATFLRAWLQHPHFHMIK